MGLMLGEGLWTGWRLLRFPREFGEAVAAQD
jgi:hypothetical protein